tara:strand:- start:1244 stop:1726 length:483 start_codon:yes stop_codon:yes gene_type:complete
MNIKVGHGIDIHQLKKNIPLVLAGLKIESKLGIVGHSDGDVVIHSIVDAILGALAQGDIGTFFPSNNHEFKDCKSSIFLEKALKIMKEKKYKILNMDINIILEKPYLNTHIFDMRENLSKLMKTDIQNISIKATTADKLGFIGSQKGIMSTSTILLIEDK